MHNTFRKAGHTGFPTVEQGEWRAPVFRLADGIRHVDFSVGTSTAPKDRVETKLLSDTPTGVTRYTSFTVRWRIAPGSDDGEAVVWLQGKEVVRYRGRLGFRGVADQLVDERFGIYRKGAPFPATISYRRLRTGTRWEEVAEGTERIPAPAQ